MAAHVGQLRTLDLGLRWVQEMCPTPDAVRLLKPRTKGLVEIRVLFESVMVHEQVPTIGCDPFDATIVRQRLHKVEEGDYSGRSWASTRKIVARALERDGRLTNRLRHGTHCQKPRLNLPIEGDGPFVSRPEVIFDDPVSFHGHKRNCARLGSAQDIEAWTHRWYRIRAAMM